MLSAVRAAGLEGRITFAGYLPDISAAYAGLDLVVIPSLSEGLPNVLLEAMLHRKPIVTTAVGGVPEVMQADLSGWLVPPGDPETLALAIIEALRNSRLREALGEIGQRHVLEAFSPASRALQMARLYQELLSS